MNQKLIINKERGLSLSIFILNHRISFNIKPTLDSATTSGIRNECKDGKYVVFLDYDNKRFEPLIDELSIIQEKFDLGDLFIFKSSDKPNGYHVIGLDKLSFKEFVSLLDESSCDPYYKEHPVILDYSSWVLRVWPKKHHPSPKLLHVLRRINQREKSRAHYIFLVSLHNIPYKYDNLDRYTTLWNITYETLNYQKELKKKK